jgi:hypothetical protein
LRWEWRYSGGGRRIDDELQGGEVGADEGRSWKWEKASIPEGEK